MLDKWRKAGYVEDNKFYPATEGVAQGGNISRSRAPALDGLESLLGTFYGSEEIDSHYNRSNLYRVHSVRFANDFAITGNTQELLEDEIRPLSGYAKFFWNKLCSRSSWNGRKAAWER